MNYINEKCFKNRVGVGDGEGERLCIEIKRGKYVMILFSLSVQIRGSLWAQRYGVGNSKIVVRIFFGTIVS